MTFVSKILNLDLHNYLDLKNFKKEFSYNIFRILKTERANIDSFRVSLFQSVSRNVKTISLKERDTQEIISSLKEIILQISYWKLHHPQEFRELGEIGKRIIKFIKPGEDGTFQSSELVQEFKKLKSSNLEKVLIFPVLFAAGAISTGYILGIFKTIKHEIMEEGL